MTDLPTWDDPVPDACTLPTTEQPVRRAEFDTLFAEDVVRVEQVAPDVLLLDLRVDPAVAARAARLAAKETGCCSFFGFDLSLREGAMTMTVSTGAEHTDVLASFGVRASARLGARG